MKLGLKEVFERPLVRVIVQKHESFYSKATVVDKKIREAIQLVLRIANRVNP